MSTDALNLFYGEPDPDRWLPYDRYPRAVVRRLVRGKPQPGGMARYFLNLRAGLDRIGVPYRVNDFGRARRNPSQPVGIVGKQNMLDAHRWKNPILYGPAVPSHPVDDPDLLSRLPVERVLVSCDWLRDMYGTCYADDRVHVWPSGVDTYTWTPRIRQAPEFDVLVYDKIRWDRERYEPELLEPIRRELAARGLTTRCVRYGSYREEDFHALLRTARAMVFLCEHETQGFAYLQTLAMGVPILAWDRGGEWRDPAYYPERVRFGPVTSVPYWDARCGVKFRGADDFVPALDDFWSGVMESRFAPREYVCEHLSLESCARRYVDHLHALA